MKLKELSVRNVRLMGQEPIRRRKSSEKRSRNGERARERYRRHANLVQSILAGVGPWLEQRRAKKLKRANEKADSENA